VLNEKRAIILPATKSVGGFVGDYVVALTGLIASVINGDSDAADMARGHRALLKEYAEPTYREGMWESREYRTRAEVAENYEEDDDATVSAWIAEQRGFVAAFAMDTKAAARLFEADDPGAKAAQDAIFKRADTWGQSLKTLGDMGKASGKANVMATWIYDGGEHCPTCAGLHNQRHRVKWYTARNYYPGKPGAAMDCGGFECKCKLVGPDGKVIFQGLAP
jgi:membrane protein involved in colicin uptake